MKASWNGMISFGLVNIPVELFPATEDKDVNFRFLHAEDDGQIKNQRVCTKCGKVIPYKDIVRGYEYADDEYVTVTDADLKTAAQGAAQGITIEEFVDPAEIDLIYYEKPYYVAPGKKSEKAYGLLAKAMLESNRVGIARIAMRTRERIAVLKASPNGPMMLYTLHYNDDVRTDESIRPATQEVGDRELKMAQMLIETMVAPFDPTKYHDIYESNLHKVIEEKLAGKQIEAPAEKRAATEVVDLMQHLKASIEAMEARGRTAEATGEEEPSQRAA